MARPQRVSETQILEAARQTFLEHGAKAPLSTIAKRLGVSTAALLHRTGSKEALLMRSLAPPLSGVLASLRAGPKKGFERAQLERLLLELNEFLSQAIPSLVVLRFAGGLVPTGEPPPTVTLRKALKSFLTKLPTRVSAEATSEALLGAMEARAFNRYLGGEAFSPGDDARFLGALLTAFLPPEVS